MIVLAKFHTFLVLNYLHSNFRSSKGTRNVIDKNKSNNHARSENRTELNYPFNHSCTHYVTYFAY